MENGDCKCMNSAVSRAMNRVFGFHGEWFNRETVSKFPRAQTYSKCTGVRNIAQTLENVQVWSIQPPPCLWLLPGALNIPNRCACYYSMEHCPNKRSISYRHCVFWLVCAYYARFHFIALLTLSTKKACLHVPSGGIHVSTVLHCKSMVTRKLAALFSC